MTPTRSTSPALVVGVALLLLAILAAAGALALATIGDGTWTDATPTDLASGRVEAGEVVWLRGMRDRAHPIEVGDGRVLFPTEDEPGVLVDCGPSACAGILRGRVDEEVLPSPSGARTVHVVHVGAPSARARDLALLVTLVATVLLVLALAAVAYGVRPARQRP